MSSVLGFYAIRLLSRFSSFDDTLDVFAVHGVGGMWGALATGIFAVAAVGGTAGLIEGEGAQLWRQLVAILATIGWTFVMTSVILIVIKYTMGLTVSEDAEEQGLDIAEHGEAAYTN